MSPMSKVQSPKSLNGDANQASQRDIGYWTLDIGLKVADLRKSFSSPTGERIEVLRGVSFSVEPGDTIAVMGASGAGKSTLLHLLSGLEAADHGTIVAGQFSINSARPDRLAHFRNSRVGLVFQFHHLLPDLTAAENVSLPLMINRIGRRQALDRALKALEEVGLGDRVSHLAGHLSGGEQQRVAVCRALISRPALLLADEPTGNLDRQNGDEIARFLVSYGRENRAIVIIATHNHAVAELCDRTMILTNGRLNSEVQAPLLP
jgi:lipoprotein-releasing system ATP-binding protein